MISDNEELKDSTFWESKGQSIIDYEAYVICGTFYLLRTEFGVTDFKYLLPAIWLG